MAKGISFEPKKGHKTELLKSVILNNGEGTPHNSPVYKE